MNKRRDFLKISGAGALGLALLGPAACKPKPAAVAAAVDRKSFGVGLQLYTVRDAISTDLQGTLKKLSEIGFKNLELAGYADAKFYGQAPSEFKKMVNDLGMEIISSHTQVEATGITKDNAKIMADAHAELGVKYCVQPWVNEPDRNIETYKKMVGNWNEVTKIMKTVDIQFG